MNYNKRKKYYLKHNQFDQYNPDKELQKYFKKLVRIDTNNRLSDREKRIAYSDIHNRFSSKSVHARIYADNFKSINPQLYGSSSERWDDYHEKHKDDWYNDHVRRSKSNKFNSTSSWDEYHEKHKDDWYNDYKKRHSD